MSRSFVARGRLGALAGLLLVLFATVDLHAFGEGQHPLAPAPAVEDGTRAAACAHGAASHVEASERVPARSCEICLHNLQSRVACGFAATLLAGVGEGASRAASAPFDLAGRLQTPAQPRAPPLA